MQPYILGTFIGVLAIVLGLYWMLALRVESQSVARIRKRLKRSIGTSTTRRFDLAKEEERSSAIGTVNHLLGRMSSVVGPLQDLIRQADVNVSVSVVLLATGTLAVGGYLALVVLTGYHGLGLLLAVLFGAVPYAYLSWKRSRRLMQFEEKFPEAIDLLARALRAGHAFTTGLGMVADELPDPVGSEFKLLYDQQNFGMPLSDALRAFAERVPLIDSRFFATAVLTQREAGGNLSEVLDNLGRVVRERFKVKRQIRVVSAHARMTGWILVGLPPVMAVVLTFLAPDNMKILVVDPIGIRLVVLAVLMQITGGLIVRRLVNIEY